jgi:hypothetical protein
MALRAPRHWLLVLSAASITYAVGTAGRAWAATRLVNYWSCNWQKYSDVLMALPSGLWAFNASPATGALVHCPLVSDDAVSHSGPSAVIRVSGRETSPTQGVSAVACVTFSATHGFYCAKPQSTGAAFVGDYNLTFTGPFGDSYPSDYPFVDVTLVATGECCTSTLRGIALSNP